MMGTYNLLGWSNTTPADWPRPGPGTRNPGKWPWPCKTSAASELLPRTSASSANWKAKPPARRATRPPRGAASKQPSPRWRKSLRIWQAFGNQPNEAGSLGQLAQIHLRLGNLPAAEHHAHAARQIGESLGLNDVWKDYDTLSEIAAARQDRAAAANWAQKRDAKLAEIKRLAGGGGGV
jgi:hypothetical protein